MKGIKFGTAGIPLSAKRNESLSGIKRVFELDLDAMELEFVQGVRMRVESAIHLRDVSESLGVLLTAHAPYYINLASTDEKKVEASIERIFRSAEVLDAAGGYSVVFHAAFFQGRPMEKVMEMVENAMKELMKRVEDAGLDVWIRPETTGKLSQFSGLDDLIELSQGFESVMPCIDFAHLHARSGGKCNSHDEFCSVLDRLEDGLGKDALREMHMHLSGIEYGPKGEKRHLPLGESDLNWMGLMDCLKERQVSGVLISESPILEMDAVRVKEYYLD